MKTSKECSVVCDLMPSYLDMLTGEKSSLLVKEHIEKCPECKKKYMQMLERQEEERELENFRGNRMKKMLRRYRYEMKGLTIGIGLSLTIIVLLIVGMFSGFFDEKKIEVHTQNISDYGEKKEYAGGSGLLLFPYKNLDRNKILEYSYNCSGTEFYQKYEIYLACQYNEKEYETEKQRLLAVKDETTGIVARYDEAEFIYPGVYAMLYDDYEYALFDERQLRIYYIFLQGMDRRDISFNLTYLPKDYGQSGFAMETERESFRIYPEEPTEVK